MRNRQKVRPPMRRGTALEIAQRFFTSGDPMPPSTREEILATQIPKAAPSKVFTFAGWTSDEKMAFYRDGTVPERYRA